MFGRLFNLLKNNKEDFRSIALKKHNYIRRYVYKKNLIIDERLNAAAQKHAEFMCKNGKLTHKGNRGSTIYDRIVAEKFPCTYCAENIAISKSVASTIDMLATSTPHYNNMIGNYTSIGIGKCENYWCFVYC